MAARGITRRVASLDWKAIAAALDDRGYALTPRLLDPDECQTLVRLYGETRRFRKEIVMERLGFGLGDYRYFARPLPVIVRELRTALYRRLAPVANVWKERLGAAGRFPPSLGGFLRTCAARGQTKPTPLLLRYGVGGYNCLHQDLYGDVAFPLQATIFLSAPGRDFGGGEFLLVENRPRAQARGIALSPDQGEMIVFATRERPVTGRRGVYRARMRHGVSPLSWGERYALGIIFHDAR